MKAFRSALSRINPDPAGRSWIYVPYDQLSLEMGPLAREPRSSLGVVLIESGAKAARRPYHRQKLALVLANQRHFALELARAGVAVDYRVTPGTYAGVLQSVAEERGPLRMMEAAERELQGELQPLVEVGRLRVLPHEGWLSSDEDFELSNGGKSRWRMDAFYRVLRRRTGHLMEGDRPLGGRWSFDDENRRPWRGEPEVPVPPSFEIDAITQEVVDLVENRFSRHPGRVDATRLPATREDAQQLWTWAKQEALEYFGPYEDAMSERSRSLFHTRISSLLNLHRILPRQLVAEVVDLQIPLNSKEGFVRQVLGWREFVRHVHRRSEGFRRPPAVAPASLAERGPEGRPRVLSMKASLPQAYWGAPSGLRCLDETVRSVWAEGYSHHITRLMVLSNIANLLDVDPYELNTWFWSAYTDAYEWVVEPNVLGMGTFATGDLMTTKPYVCGAGYIDRMGDHCGTCAFDPKKNCPLTRLYWAYLERHREALSTNPRMSLVYRNLARRDEEEKAKDARVFDLVSERLGRSEPIQPADLESQPTLQMES